MSYEPKEWVSGEVITANGLNNIEDGIQEALECCEGSGGIVEVGMPITRGTVTDTEVYMSIYGEVNPTPVILCDATSLEDLMHTVFYKTETDPEAPGSPIICHI